MSMATFGFGFIACDFEKLSYSYLTFIFISRYNSISRAKSARGITSFGASPLPAFFLPGKQTDVSDVEPRQSLQLRLQPADLHCYLKREIFFIRVIYFIIHFHKMLIIFFFPLIIRHNKLPISYPEVVAASGVPLNLVSRHVQYIIDALGLEQPELPDREAYFARFFSTLDKQGALYRS
jgi:hypothetical protein